ncbi:MAG: FtsL-like putative cell division protein [Pseudoflavonifractor sp.]|nr:FtsL-like putative cell division protein [Alloprevotella sp.]MCM1117421.1 FtsL-like putative cell division protein [Pseudoflavonifractor sp.]
MPASQPSSKPRNHLSIISRLLHGQLISLDFFKRNWLVVFTALTIVMMYITNKYNTQTKMEEIRALNRELEIVKTERIRERSAYMSRIRESEMQALIDSIGLGLSVSEQPPYKITQQ